MARDLAEKKVEAALQRKGFRRDETAHHVFIFYTRDGRQTAIETATSHGTARGKKDISDNLLSQMAKQCQLSTRDFLASADCPMEQEEHERLLRERGIL